MQSQKPVLRQEQRLKMTPQLYQAIKIMSLPLQDLRDTIEEELEKNPALEVIEDQSTESLEEQEKKQAEEDDYFDDASDAAYSTREGEEASEAKRKFIERVVTYPESLQEHLLWQLRLQPISERQLQIGELLIRNLDERGFHLEPPQTLVKAEELPMLEAMKEMIQSFDPVGTCTADYREALLAQIRNHPAPYPGSFEVVDRCLELLEKERYREIAKQLKIEVEEVLRIKTYIRELEPYPGRNFASEQPRYVIPDLSIKLQEGEFVLMLNDESIPVLGVNPFFTNLSDDKERFKEKKLKNFVSSSLQEARWFIRSIHQRNETLLKVCKTIIEFQRNFFRKGPQSLAPLTLKEIAREIGVHEATVSRVTNGKYIQTEWGIFELKYFFSNSVPGYSPGGIRFSKEGVKHMIKEIVGGKGGKRALTDQQLVEMLAVRGVKIARRTVAKYRKELDIMSSYHRPS